MRPPACPFEHAPFSARFLRTGQVSAAFSFAHRARSRSSRRLATHSASAPTTKKMAQYIRGEPTSRGTAPKRLGELQQVLVPAFGEGRAVRLPTPELTEHGGIQHRKERRG